MILPLLTIWFMALVSCDVTDQTPVTLVPEEEAFSDAQKVFGNILGVYDAAQRGFFLGVIQRGYPFGAASIQQGDMRSGDMYNDQLFYEITYINGFTPSTANNSEFWVSMYRLINRINVVLEGIDGALADEVISQELYNTYRGELLFFRALSHAELLMHFSRPYSDNPSEFGVPYRDFAVNNTDRVVDAEQVDRGTVGGTYERIMADLNEAEGIAGDIGPFRGSRGAVIALKLRVNMHMENWAGVIEEFGKLDYTLASSPEIPFTSPDGNPESIFSLNNTPESNPGVNGALAAMYGDPAQGGRGLVKVSPLSWNWDFWHPEDIRRAELTVSGPAGIYTAKYTGYINRDDPTPLLRYAESVLNTAEAHARLGDLDEAVTLLNRVRDRALPAGVASHTVGSLGGDAAGVLQAIWNEKRIEFLAEGIWWHDIHRLSGRGDLPGIPLKAASRSITSIDFYEPGADIPTDHSLPYSSNLFIWPIPLQEVVNNPVLAAQQNPGY